MPTPTIEAAEAARMLDDLSAIVARASTAILSISADALDKRLKADQSPVTAADEAAEQVIAAGLARLAPEIPVISEEMSGAVPSALPDCFFMVDPLDGTKEFVSGSPEYTVNVAIISRGAPLAGIVAAPKGGTLWRGVVGRGAERLRLRADDATGAEPIRARRWPAHDPVAVVSRSHLDPATEAFLARLGPVIRSSSGSAVKFCRLAEGAADVYPRLSPVCEWDVAAGHAVLAAAGGLVQRPDGGPLPYGRIAADFRVPAFVAWGDPQKAAALAG